MDVDKVEVSICSSAIMDLQVDDIDDVEYDEDGDGDVGEVVYGVNSVKYEAANKPEIVSMVVQQALGALPDFLKPMVLQVMDGSLQQFSSFQSSSLRSVIVLWKVAPSLQDFLMGAVLRMAGSAGSSCALNPLVPSVKYVESLVDCLYQLEAQVLLMSYRSVDSGFVDSDLSSSRGVIARTAECSDEEIADSSAGLLEEEDKKTAKSRKRKEKQKVKKSDRSESCI